MPDLSYSLRPTPFTTMGLSDPEQQHHHHEIVLSKVNLANYSEHTWMDKQLGRQHDMVDWNQTKICLSAPVQITLRNLPSAGLRGGLSGLGTRAGSAAVGTWIMWQLAWCWAGQRAHGCKSQMAVSKSNSLLLPTCSEIQSITHHDRCLWTWELGSWEVQEGNWIPTFPPPPERFPCELRWQ